MIAKFQAFIKEHDGEGGEYTGRGTQSENGDCTKGAKRDGTVPAFARDGPKFANKPE